jgi:hypothetical protein
MTAALNPVLVRRGAGLLLGITVLEGACVLLFPAVFLAPLRQSWAAAGAGGWLSALVVALAYCLYSIRRLQLRPYLTLLSWFKLLGPLMAVPTSILEEVFFRMQVMDALAHHGYGLAAQVSISALVFGAVHAVWAFRGGVPALIGAVGATSVLGALLAVVYLLSQRVVWPCVAAHFLVNAVCEPWLVYAYALRTTLRAQKTV